jgi:hypothetical protein
VPSPLDGIHERARGRLIRAAVNQRFDDLAQAHAVALDADSLRAVVIAAGFTPGTVTREEERVSVTRGHRDVALRADARDEQPPSVEVGRGDRPDGRSASGAVRRARRLPAPSEQK